MHSHHVKSWTCTARNDSGATNTAVKDIEVLTTYQLQTHTHTHRHTHTPTTRTNKNKQCRWRSRASFVRLSWKYISSEEGGPLLCRVNREQAIPSPCQAGSTRSTAARNPSIRNLRNCALDSEPVQSKLLVNFRPKPPLTHLNS